MSKTRTGSPKYVLSGPTFAVEPNPDRRRFQEGTYVFTIDSMSSPWPDEPTIRHNDEFEPLIEIHLPREPVSLGAAGAKRRRLKAELRKLTREVPWVFTGDVSVTIEWTVHLRWRYESDRALDIDNIVKPILDGLTGPEGCLIDDTQVNHVSVNWMTWTRTDRQHIKVSFRSLDPALYEQRGFALVEIRPSLCIPMPSLAEDKDARLVLMDAVESQFDAHDDLLALGAPWEYARSVLPIQRVFHRNKLTAFTTMTPSDYRSAI